MASEVDAAQAATGAIDLLAHLATTASVPTVSRKRKASTIPIRAERQSSSQPMLAPPLQMELPPVPESPKLDDKCMKIHHKRTRAAAGYTPPPAAGTPLSPKKGKLDPPQPIFNMVDVRPIDITFGRGKGFHGRTANE